MKAEDIVRQLQIRLPLFTDLFTDNASVISLILSGSTVTATTSAAHGFSINQYVNISGAQTIIKIDTFTRSGTIGTITTLTDHDFTLGPQISQTGVTAESSGANESEFNGSFNVIGVPNRRTIQVQMVDSGATAATGAPQLDNGESVLNQYNGLFQILSVPTTTTFTYQITNAPLEAAVGTIQARANPRVSGAITIDRAEETYTKQGLDKLWLFVILGDALASKNRQILSDATDNIQRANFFRQQVTELVNLYVFFPATQTIAGRLVGDIARDLLQPITRSILFKRFDTQVFRTGEFGNPLQFLSHGFSNYNSAFYVHEYVFEQVFELNFEDSVGFDEDVAFRDVNVTFQNNQGNENFTAKIDLDEEILP